MKKLKFKLAIFGIMLAMLLLAHPALAQPTNVTIQQPVLGVSIDAQGLLTTKLFQDPKNGQLMMQRLAQGGLNRVGDLKKPAEIRKISLRQLEAKICLLYTSPSPRDATLSRMPSSA